MNDVAVGKPDKIKPGSPRLLVIGCGNPFAADDNVGLEIVHRLRERGDLECEFVELAGADPGPFDVFDKAEIIVFVDAVESGAPAGTVHLLPLPSHEVAPRALGRISSHGWGLEETLRLRQSLGWRIPRLMLLGVELENVTPGLPRTPAIDVALGAVVECFLELATALRNGESPIWSGHHAYPVLRPGFTTSN